LSEQNQAMRKHHDTSASSLIRRLPRAMARFMKILFARSGWGADIEFTCDHDGRPFRAYVRGTKSKPKPSAENIERALRRAQAKWDAANR
jgi:hypothetical protein